MKLQWPFSRARKRPFFFSYVYHGGNCTGQGDILFDITGPVTISTMGMVKDAVKLDLMQRYVFTEEPTVIIKFFAALAASPDPARGKPPQGTNQQRKKKMSKENGLVTKVEKDAKALLKAFEKGFHELIAALKSKGNLTDEQTAALDDAKASVTAGTTTVSDHIETTDTALDANDVAAAQAPVTVAITSSQAADVGGGISAKKVVDTAPAAKTAGTDDTAKAAPADEDGTEKDA